MAHDSPTWLLDLGLESTLLLGAGLALAAVLRRRSAAERHLVLVAALLGVLVQPGAAALFSAAGLDPVGIGPLVARLRADPPRNAGAGPRAAPRQGVAGARGGAARRAAANATAAAASGANRMRALRSGAGVDLATLAGGLYLAVAAWIFAVHAASAARVSRRIARMRTLRDEEGRGLAVAVAAELGIDRRIRWRVDATAHTPWAWGLFHPTVAVPPEFAEWTEAEQRGALVHELAHIVRRDTLSALLAHLGCAVYWFQPLAWLAARGVRREAELACDDRVLLAGCERTSYAAQLLALATTIYRARSPQPPAPAMARASFVSRRIRAILDERRRRNTVSQLKIAIAGSITLALVAPLAALRSQEPAADTGLTDPAFQALLAAGPTNDGELTQVVETLIGGGATAEAERVLVEWLSRDGDGPVPCRVCVLGLRDEATRANALTPAVVEAFAAVEARAQAQADGRLLVRLADVSLASRSRPAVDRGLHYLLQADTLGGGTASAARRQTTIRYLLELGQYEKARSLAQESYDDPDSGVYHAEAIERLIKYIDNERSRIDRLSAKLVSSDAGTVTAEGEYLPIYKGAPVYPQKAAELGREGHVVVEYTVGTTGQTHDVRIYESSDPLFDEAAVASARSYRYAPRIEGGSPVEVPGVRTIIRFKLAP